MGDGRKVDEKEGRGWLFFCLDWMIVGSHNDKSLCAQENCQLISAKSRAGHRDFL